MEREGAVDHEELKAAIEARRELGAELEPHVVDAFVERIERRLADRAPARPARKDDSDKTLALAILSLAFAIPITAIAATHGGIVAMAVVWAGIVLVNLAYARRH
ncbi:MAG TPA: hypothetical protein VE736_12480 [Gaiellaceae bacterium]|jgi:hypothetical protein|nr:hypothetical protein [Gaiellaceae bacterium]